MAKNDADKITVWNQMVEALSVLDYPIGEQLLDDAFVVFHYYSEMESGGHEIFLNWFSEEMRKTDFSKRLTSALEKIGAGRYAAIEREYGTVLLQKYMELDSGKGSEEEFYRMVEKADSAYYALAGQLGELLEVHFLNIHPKVIRK